MMDELRERYELGPAVATLGGWRHDGRRRADGRPVSVHRLSGASAAQTREAWARLLALGPGDAATVMEVVGTTDPPTLVTEPLPDGVALLDWLGTRPVAAPLPPALPMRAGARAAARPPLAAFVLGATLLLSLALAAALVFA